MGYCLHHRLGNEGCLKALNMALEQKSKLHTNLIHHSDRGVQYCSKDYVQRLESAKIAISMTEKGDPYENAIAERVNGILKSEFMLNQTFATAQEAMEAIVKAVSIYNESRPHMSCNYLTPAEAHLQTGALERKWKTYYRNQPANETA